MEETPSDIYPPITTVRDRPRVATIPRFRHRGCDRLGLRHRGSHQLHGSRTHAEPPDTTTLQPAGSVPPPDSGDRSTTTGRGGSVQQPDKRRRPRSKLTSGSLPKPGLASISTTSTPPSSPSSSHLSTVGTDVSAVSHLTHP